MRKIFQIETLRYGQGARPIKQKLSEDDGGAVIVNIARDIDDYIHKGEGLDGLMGL